MLPSLIDASASLEWILCLLRAETRLSDPADPRPLLPLRQAVAFEHVSFGYASGRTNLHDVSFRIPHGSFAAFVGSSGAGKSTLINLVMALDHAQRLRGQGVCILAPSCATAGRATEPACVAPATITKHHTG